MRNAAPLPALPSMPAHKGLRAAQRVPNSPFQLLLNFLLGLIIFPNNAVLLYIQSIGPWLGNRKRICAGSTRPKGEGSCSAS